MLEAAADADTPHLLDACSQARKSANECFGDFCTRVGFDALRDYAKNYVPSTAVEELPKVAVDESTFKALQSLAAREGKSLAHVANEALQQLSGSAV